MQSIAERRKYILECINRRGTVKVTDLSEELNVTKATIRKDLKFLEDIHSIFRTHGSALPVTQTVSDVDVEVKSQLNIDLKRRIALAASDLLLKDDAIIIASGSTMTAFAEAIAPVGHLNVVTPSVRISYLLGRKPDVTVMQLGGQIYGNSLSVRGVQASHQLRTVLCSKLFFGADGFSPDYGVTCATSEEAIFTREMMKCASESIVLADSSKIGKRGLGKICDMKDVGTIVTDSGISASVRKSIEALGVRVVVV